MAAARGRRFAALSHGIAEEQVYRNVAAIAVYFNALGVFGADATNVNSMAARICARAAFHAAASLYTFYRRALVDVS